MFPIPGSFHNFLAVTFPDIDCQLERQCVTRKIQLTAKIRSKDEQCKEQTGRLGSFQQELAHPADDIRVRGGVHHRIHDDGDGQEGGLRRWRRHHLVPAGPESRPDQDHLGRGLRQGQGVDEQDGGTVLLAEEDEQGGGVRQEERLLHGELHRRFPHRRGREIVRSRVLV